MLPSLKFLPMMTEKSSSAEQRSDTENVLFAYLLGPIRDDLGGVDLGSVRADCWHVGLSFAKIGPVNLERERERERGRH